MPLAATRRITGSQSPIEADEGFGQPSREIAFLALSVFYSTFQMPVGNVSGTSPISHSTVRSSGSTARVSSKCSTASN